MVEKKYLMRDMHINECGFSRNHPGKPTNISKIDSFISYYRFYHKIRACHSFLQRTH